MYIYSYEAGAILPMGQLTIFEDRFGFELFGCCGDIDLVFLVSNTGFSLMTSAVHPLLVLNKSVSHIYLLLCASPKRTGYGSGLIESYNLHMPTNKTRLKNVYGAKCCRVRRCWKATGGWVTPPMRIQGGFLTLDFEREGRLND